MNCKLKLQSKGLYVKKFWCVPVIKFLKRLALGFPKICLIFPGTFLQTNILKILISGCKSSSASNTLNFFSRILRSEGLVYYSYFFRTAVLRKLVDIRFSYKRCNFSRGCLLVKMASKAVTRSITST